jgi:hypothetical protein
MSPKHVLLVRTFILLLSTILFRTYYAQELVEWADNIFPSRITVVKGSSSSLNPSLLRTKTLDGNVGNNVNDNIPRVSSNLKPIDLNQSDKTEGKIGSTVKKTVKFKTDSNKRSYLEVLTGRENPTH